MARGIYCTIGSYSQLPFAGTMALFAMVTDTICVDHAGKGETMGQVVRTMSENMVKRIEHQRNWVKGHLTDESSLRYDTVEGKLLLLQGIIDGNFYQKNQTMELQSLGVTFGDLLVQNLDLEWVEVEDEYGIDPALRHKDTVTHKNILLFPLTMISKRIENDEVVNVEQLFHLIDNMVQEMINGGLRNGN
jgi:hypothetical protein